MSYVDQLSAKLKARAEAERAATQETIERFRRRMDDYRAQKDKERADAEAEKAKRLQEAREAEFDKKHKHAALSAWLASGGTREDFEAQWPEMAKEIRQHEVESELNRRRQVTARQYRRSF